MSSSLMYKPNQPQFFKIILDDRLRTLSIPRKFVKNYGNKLSDSVILKVPSGDKWRVGILKVKGQIWLEKGWHKFLECYSIVIGRLLVFRYDESNSGFHVTIFDSTCSEIDYPYRHHIINEVAEEPQVPAEVSSPFSPSRKRKEKSPLSYHPHKKMKKTVENFTNTTPKGTKTGKKQNRISLQKQMMKRTMEGKSKAIYRGSSSLPSQNPTFKTAISPTHVHYRGGSLVIPVKFVRKYMKKDGDAFFDVLNAKIWSVKYYTMTLSTAQTRTKVRCSSWNEFVEGNHLTVGDVCKFELIDPDKALFKVVIFRSSTGANAAAELQVPKVESDDIPVEISDQFSPSRNNEKSSPLSSSRPHKKMKNAKNFINITRKEKKENGSFTLNKRSKAIQGARSSFQSQNPTFQIKMKPSHVRDWCSRPSIPPSIARKYMKRKNGEALINVLDGRTWSIKYFSGVKRTRLLHSSWNRFVRDCYLKVGDICKFELIDPHKTVFKVIISRSTTREIFSSSSKQSMDKKTRTIPRKNSSSSSVKASGNFTSGNPFFKVVIKSGDLDHNRVNLPVGFFKNLKQTRENAKLVLYGKMWYVKLLVYQNHGCGTLSAGWASFARENCLKAGDICTFELIDAQEMLIKVSISRNSSTN